MPATKRPDYCPPCPTQRRTRPRESKPRRQISVKCAREMGRRFSAGWSEEAVQEVMQDVFRGDPEGRAAFMRGYRKG